MKFKSLGEFLKYFSETREYTYEYIGLKTGLKKATISHYVNGRRNPSKEFIESFLKEFTGAKKFLMHKDKIILDNTLVIYYIQEGKEYIVKRVEEKNEKEFI